MEKKNLYIDFDGVILDTIKPLYDDYKAQNIEKENAKEFYVNYPWKDIIDDKYIINDSINDIYKIIDSKKFNLAILTHINSTNEAVLKIKYLRKFILESSFYFSANLVSALTNIIFKMNKLKFDKFKIYYFNTLNIICAILKMNSKVVYKDPDNTNHIKMCLKFLLSNNNTVYEEWNKYMQKYETSLKLAQDQSKLEQE